MQTKNWQQQGLGVRTKTQHATATSISAIFAATNIVMVIFRMIGQQVVIPHSHRSLRETRTMPGASPPPPKRQRTAQGSAFDAPDAASTQAQPIDHIFITDGLLNRKPGGKKVR